MQWKRAFLTVLFTKGGGGVKILIVVLMLLFGANVVLASFGISPPFILNDHLLPGSHFEQKIVLSRGAPEDDLKAEVTIDAPEIGEWITIDKGLSFVLPKGQQQVPIYVSIDVPKDAEPGKYQGKIRIRVLPSEGAGEGMITIVTGGQIRVELAVSNEEFSDFKVQIFRIPKVEEGQPIKVSVRIENTGNVPTAPSKVHLDVYDEYQVTLLGSGDDTDLELVEGFKTKEITAEFPIELGAGYYFGEVKIFKGEEVVKGGRIHFEVVEKGTLISKKEEEGKGWLQNLRSKSSSLYIGAGIIFLLSISLLIWALRKRRKMAARRKKTIKIIDIKKKEE